MELSRHPDFYLQKLTIGREKAPLLVIDNFVADAERLVEASATAQFQPLGRAFPGIRAKAPKAYMQLILSELGGTLADYFRLSGTRVSFPMCHYSIVTTPPEELELIQRVPHIDSSDNRGLASIHYLFQKNLGGTSFYRHRATGYEYIDESRAATYFNTLEKESANPDFPGCRYINGDTPFFERIAAQEGIFNRMLIYRRNSLHSGSIDENFVPDPDPLTGRLSINSFIDIK